MMNNPIVRSYAEGFAKRVVDATGDSTVENVKRSYMTALGRQPMSGELADAKTFIDAQSREYQEQRLDDSRRLAVTDFCQTLLSLNEFIYVD